MRPGSGSGLTSMAGGVATVLVAGSLVPLIQGPLLWMVVLLVVGVVVVTGGLVRLVVGVPLPTVAQLVVLVLTLTAIFGRDQALLGVIPGRDAVTQAGYLVGEGMATIRDQGPPVTPEPGLLFLVAVGVGLVAVLVDLIASDLHAPAAAGLPLLAVLSVPAGVLHGGMPWPWFALAAVGFLLLVAADQPERLRRWGVRVFGGGRARPGAQPPVAGLGQATWAGVAVLALGLAVAVPAAVPGLDRSLVAGSGLGEGNGSGTNVAVVNPILDLRKQLSSNDNRVVIRYQTTVADPAPLRIVTADVFNGRTWEPSRPSLPRSNRVQDGLPQAPGLSSAVEQVPQQTTIQIDGLAQAYLPLPYPTTRVEISGTWLYDPSTLNVLGVGVTTADIDSYLVDHVSVDPTRAQLEAAPAGDPQLDAKYTDLPSLPAVIAQTARKVAGNGTAYDKAFALQQWFRSDGGFAYDVVPSGSGQNDSSSSAVADFLRGKRGYCVQFASAMAVMARTLGIPARVAIGFLPGTLDPATSTPGRQGYAINLQEAHAWPELYFSGIGWVRFEPTPAVQSGPAPAYARPPVSTGPSSSSSAASASSRSSASTASSSATSTAAAAPSGSAGGTRWAPYALLLVALIVLCALLALTPRALAAGRRTARRRWARAAGREPASRSAEGAWAELRERLADLGIGWESALTPRGVARYLTDRFSLEPGSEPRQSLDRLTAALERARYAPPPRVLSTVGGPLVGPPDAGPEVGASSGVDAVRAGGLWTDVDAVVGAARLALPVEAVRRATWRPESAWAQLRRQPLDAAPSVARPGGRRRV